MTNNPSKHSTYASTPPEIIRLLEQPVPRDLVFDDDSVEATLYGGSPSPPTPVNVTEMIRTGIEVSDDCLNALAAILVNHPEELISFAETTETEHQERVLAILLCMSRQSAAENALFLKTFSRCMGRLGRAEDALALGCKARAAELGQRDAAYLKRMKAMPLRAAVLNEYALFLKNECSDYIRAEEYYRKALELSPADATCLNNLAVLMMSTGRYEEAEACFRRSLDQKPNDANTLSNLAVLWHNFGGRSQEAEEIFLKAIEVNPNEAAVRANYAALLIAQDSWDRAEVQLAKGWEAQDSSRDRISARILFLRICLDGLEEKDCGFHTGQLKSLFESGMIHSPWAAAAVLTYLQEKMTPEEVEFLQVLFHALTNWNDLAMLNRFGRWTNQAPVSLTIAWP